MPRSRGTTQVGLLALEREDQTEDRDGLGQSDGQNADHEHLGKGSGITTDRLDHASSDQTDADGGSSSGNTEGETTCDRIGRSQGLCKNVDKHVMCWFVVVLFPATVHVWHGPGYQKSSKDKLSVPRALSRVGGTQESGE